MDTSILRLVATFVNAAFYQTLIYENFEFLNSKDLQKFKSVNKWS